MRIIRNPQIQKEELLTVKAGGTYSCLWAVRSVTTGVEVVRIKMDLKEVRLESVDWIHLDLDRDWWRTLMNTVVKAERHLHTRRRQNFESYLAGETLD